VSSPKEKESTFLDFSNFSTSCPKAQNPDELSIVESEQLEVVGDGDGDGWLRARNYKGEEGFVPHNYLDVERDVTTNDQGNRSSQLVSQISFSSVDYTVENEEQDGCQDSVLQSPDQVSVISAPTRKPQQQYCVALYDYDASAEDELTFEEGQVNIFLPVVLRSLSMRFLPSPPEDYQNSNERSTWNR
jgi:SH3 domain